MHGCNGLESSASFKSIQSYVLQLLLYELEAVILSTSEIELLENFYRNLRQRVQSLPKEAIYLLTEATPVYMLIHQSPVDPDESLHRLATCHLGLSVRPS